MGLVDGQFSDLRVIRCPCLQISVDSKFLVVKIRDGYYKFVVLTFLAGCHTGNNSRIILGDVVDNAPFDFGVIRIQPCQHSFRLRREFAAGRIGDLVRIFGNGRTGTAVGSTCVLR